MKRRTIITFILSLCFLMVYTSEAQKVGTTSLKFLKVMPTAQATAMGEAYVAVASGVDGLFWNPATIVNVQSYAFTSTYTQWLFDTKQYALGYAMSLGNWGHVGVQFQTTDIGTIQETSVDRLGYTDYQDNAHPGSFADGFTGRTFTPSSWELGLTYAKQLTDHFAVGFTAMYISESLWDKSTFTAPDLYGVLQTYNSYVHMALYDFGMLYNTGFRSIRIGASIQHFGSQVQFAQLEFPAPMIFRLGIAAEIIGKTALFFPDAHNRLTVATDIIQPNDYDQQMHFGAEYAFAEMIALRVGYKWNYDSDGLTFGGGINFDVGSVITSVDYSYGSMGEYLTNVHRISLGVKFK